ncbi:translin [Desarmillaria tabescens]|uniref:Translin n=1 Tax=Armillaria tabescens TaxID=1929756 RepID=A0AA39TS03_ARMTA|nr:translin [Desarmillaria tabescens]KAK0464563.1 translin [Desarmillaria tabescens]
MDPHDLENLNTTLDHEAQLREKIKEQVVELDKKTRTMVGMLNKIHSIPYSQVPGTHVPHTALADLTLWTNSLRNSVFVAAFLEYLSKGTLISLASTSEALGIQDEWKDRFTLSIEDYLHGLITLVNELSRLAVNAVTLGNFQEPVKISIFVKDLFAGFTMLNLKNDQLRRRFDSLKYDMKKVEEVVYDVSLRKLAQPPDLAPG